MERGRENDGEIWAGSTSRGDAGCSKRKRDDHVSVDVLDKLDLGSDPPSSDGDDISASDPELEAKHEIFLSHSGKQKDFTELLCRELERSGYCPFFDVREDSLPKGKRFPDLIFRAARECRVAVLILSEAFFTETKWPMLELAAVVDAQGKSWKEKRAAVDILPVYLELRREDCRKDENVERWVKRWEEMENSEMAEKMKEMDELGRAQTQAQCKAARERGELRSQKWKEAMKVLGPSNGIEYERSSREGGLIDRVVSAVRGLLPPPNMANDPGTQAKGRICESLIEMIARTQASANGARVVGVYGMGGMGKTTFCKELCCELYRQFEGKVCHAELGRLSESELQRKVLQKLTDVNHRSLSSAEDSKVSDYVKTRMRGEKVFLALDNVWAESKGEAMVYVKQARYGEGSIVMVTARSIDILLSLRIKSSDCFAMPELEEEDAKRLFLHHAAPDFQSRHEEDEDDIRRCVFECHFFRGGEGGSHFLPLALKVLGQQMHGVGENPRKWVESLSKEDKFDLDRKKEHPIFGILGRGYDVLRREDQLLFMDAAFCNPYWHPPSMWWDNPPWGWTLFEWLSIVHYGTISKVSLITDRLQGLKARALLEDIGDGTESVYVHDLYHDFAQFEASRGDLDARHVVWHTWVTELPMDLVKTPSGRCWSHVERIGVVDRENWILYGDLAYRIVVDKVTWQCFANVVVLVLTFGADQELDLRGLQCLRSLVVHAERSTVKGFGELRKLGWLELVGVHCGPDLWEVGCLTELQLLRVSTDCSFGYKSGCIGRLSPPSRILNLQKCINLRQLSLCCACVEVLPDLRGMRDLRRVKFRCSGARKGPGGLDSRLRALHDVVLSGCHSLLDPLHQVHEVVSLQRLEVRSLPQLKMFPDIRMMTRLRILEIACLRGLVQVPGLGELVALEEFRLSHLPKLKELPSMRLLTKLRWISLRRVGKVEEWPRLLDMVPSQLRFFSCAFGTCGLRSEDSLRRRDEVDLHEWYRSPSATVLRDIHPRYPCWGVAQIS